MNRANIIFDSEVWTATNNVEHLNFRIFERNVLRKIYGVIRNIEGSFMNVKNSDDS